MCLVVTLFMLLTCALGEQLAPSCNIPRNKCTLKTTLNNNSEVHLAVQCLCIYRDSEEDRSEGLQKLSKSHCPSLPPDDQSPRLHYSSLKIQSCPAQDQSLPEQLVDRLRRSLHLHVEIIDSPGFLMPDVSSRYYNYVPKITGVIQNSVIKGLGSGLFGHTGSLSLNITGSSLDIIGASSFSGYVNATDVKININNSIIGDIRQKAFMLPAQIGDVSIRNSKIEKWKDSGYSGGHSLYIENATLDYLYYGAVNIYYLKRLTLFRSIIAFVRNGFMVNRRLKLVNGDNKVNDLHKTEHVVISENKFIKFHGEALINTCDVINFTFAHNVIREVIEAPLKLQSQKCQTERDWAISITNTTFYCISSDYCKNFQTMDEQICPIYTSGICLTSELFEPTYYKNYSSALLPYIASNCPDSQINQTCGFETTFDRWNYSRSLEYSSNAALPSINLVLMLSVIMTFVILV